MLCESLPRFCMGCVLLPYCGRKRFALMWSNVRDINKMMDEPPKPRHPEAPAPGDEVMYVDLTKERLEQLYDDK